MLGDSSFPSTTEKGKLGESKVSEAIFFLSFFFIFFHAFFSSRRRWMKQAEKGAPHSSPALCLSAETPTTIPRKNERNERNKPNLNIQRHAVRMDRRRFILVALTPPKSVTLVGIIINVYKKPPRKYSLSLLLLSFATGLGVGYYHLDA